MSAKTAAPDSGSPDFDKKSDKTVKGPSTPVPSSGTPDFMPGQGQKTVRKQGEAPMPKAYETEKKAQTGPDSYF